MSDVRELLTQIEAEKPKLTEAMRLQQALEEVMALPDPEPAYNEFKSLIRAAEKAGT